MLVFLVAPLMNATGSFPGHDVVALSDGGEEEKVAVYCTFFNKDGSRVTEKFFVSNRELDEIRSVISDLMERFRSEKREDVLGAIKMVCMKHREGSLSRRLVKFFENLRPLQKRTFIVSNGFGRRFDVQHRSKVRVFKSFIFWHYYGQRKYLNFSKTIIVDPFLPKVRVLDGWQIGMMRRFIGLYIHVSGSMFEKGHTFFMGYAYKVRALDLPDFT